jgi:transposase
MCLKIHSPWAMPEETGRVGRMLLKEIDPYRLIGAQLFEKWREEEFADLYSSEGKPGYSPVILAFVSVFQFMERLADRQAAQALRMRLDWKYALHLPLEDAGFDFSVLSEFRDRLIEGKAEKRVFEKLVEEIRAMGLIKERGKQRSDSIAMLVKVRRLSRIEMVVETLRLAVVALVEVNREWCEEIIPPSWEDRYGERFVRQRYSEQEWKEYEANIGNDGMWLLKRLTDGGAPAELQDLPEVQVLSTVWAQQFREAQGQMVYKDLKKYDGHSQIQNPHDPEARYSRKRKFEWLGDKVQVTETCEAETVHLITHVETSSAVEQDVSVTERIHAALDAKGILPGEHLLDTGYIGAELLVNAKEDYGIVICGPVRKDVLWQANSGDGFGLSNFQINWKAQSVTCPRGRQSNYWSPRTNQYHQPVIQVRFRKEDCCVCPVQSKCTRSKLGIRHLLLLPQAQYEALQKARQEQQTPAFWKKYAKRAGIEGTISQGVRAFDLRFSRYIGLAKTHIQMVGSAIAINMYRLYNWVNGVPQALTRIASFAQLAPDPSLIPSGWRT